MFEKKKEIVLARGKYNIERIMEEWNKLKMPQEYKIPFFNIEDFMTHDYCMYMSTRNEGKTTNLIIFGMILYKLYGTITEYVRNDTEMTTKSALSSIFETIISFNYINQLFDARYNDVVYVQQKKCFDLVYRDDNGEIIEREEGFFRVKSNEDWLKYKSGYACPTSDFILFDEFLDTKRNHYGITQELFNNISTFTRERESAFCVMVSNNVNKFATIFEDFCISEDVKFMDNGDKLDVTTPLGTTVYVELLPLSKKKTERIEKKKIRFFGFENDKFAAFTGLSAWQGFSYPHIMKEMNLKSQEIIAFIYHRKQYIAIYLAEFETETPALLFTKFDTPKRDGIVFTTKPKYDGEMKFRDAPKFIAQLFNNDRFYFSTNEIGLLVDDFLQESDMEKIMR